MKERKFKYEKLNEKEYQVSFEGCTLGTVAKYGGFKYWKFFDNGRYKNIPPKCHPWQYANIDNWRDTREGAVAEYYGGIILNNDSYLQSIILPETPQEKPELRALDTYRRHCRVAIIHPEKSTFEKRMKDTRDILMDVFGYTFDQLRIVYSEEKQSNK